MSHTKIAARMPRSRRARAVERLFRTTLAHPRMGHGLQSGTIITGTSLPLTTDTLRPSESHGPLKTQAKRRPTHACSLRRLTCSRHSRRSAATPLFPTHG